MSQTLYKTEEGKVAPRVPDFLRGRFFDLVDLGPDGNYEADGSPVILGWVNIDHNGIVEFGEPGA